MRQRIRRKSLYPDSIKTQNNMKKYINYIIKRVIVRTYKKEVKSEIVAESKEEAQVIVDKLLKGDREIINNNGTEEYGSSRGTLLSVEETIEIEEAK